MWERIHLPRLRSLGARLGRNELMVLAFAVKYFPYYIDLSELLSAVGYLGVYRRVLARKLHR